LVGLTMDLLTPMTMPVYDGDMRFTNKFVLHVIV